MTCTADSEYIRAVSVKYRRCPSSCSTRTAVDRAGFRVKSLPPRPRTAVEGVVSPSLRPRSTQAVRERTKLLDELIFFYGRNVHTSFDLTTGHSSPDRPDSGAPSRPSPADSAPTPFTTPFRPSQSPTRASLSSAWSCQNEALRQMYKASERRPRHRFFSSGLSLRKPSAVL